MLKLVRCEFTKLKRKKFILLVILAAFLFPIPFTMLAMNGGFGGLNVYDKLFGMIVSYGQALLLPSILGIVASMLFFMERDNDTLKNLRTIPVSATRMVTAKILVLFILGLIFSLASVAASMLGGAFVGNIQGVFAKLCISAADGMLLTAGTLPVVIAIVFFNRSYIFSIILAFFYTILNFSMAFVGLQYDTPMMKLLTSILPTPIIYRWLLGLFTSPADSFYAIIAPKILPLPQVIIIIAIIALISYMAIVRIYNKRED
ncbi:MAG: ABC transporter permease [Paenibacillus macerans]|uniref:ABC transporter permease n=1 Tax=Paenibacillus macerans TaxID=44252 RepID=UPI0029137CFC|nr:ABC transporter permease [Paenibacillus macerans]MDU7474722.1 ABC transporter permease [Paenibacillus macerans]